MAYKIALAAGKFFDKYPELLDNEIVEEIAVGEEGEREEKYGKLEGWKELNEALAEFYDNYSVPQKYQLVLNEKQTPEFKPTKKHI